ncbi:helix-turn-helix transcriptional regulator [Saccharospirillum impatiens]|uniref:helix-turn-helix transcriptional regulator n=1 Tax=Saccharospirillum impatiens TaxID=169438 RepID=UPI000402F8DE|nr:AraC family transcriptional regulator [Saccharospirillum impatiens]
MMKTVTDQERMAEMAFLQLRAATLTRQHVSHAHAHHQLILATSGVTNLRIEHQEDQITKTCGCLIPSTYHHDYVGDGANRTLVLDIPQASLATLVFSDELERLFAAPRFYPVSAQLQDLARSLMNQVEHTPHLQTSIASLLLRALYHQLFSTDLPPHTLNSQHRLKGRDRIDLTRIDRFIDLHLADQITVESLSGLCALSPGHFHSCFREVTGQTPLSYVQQRRLQAAYRLVTDTSLALARVAERVGFRDQGSFSRAFRRQFGVSPSQSRG